MIIGLLRYAPERVASLYDVKAIFAWRTSDRRNIERLSLRDDIGVVADLVLIHQVDSCPVGLGAVVIGPLRYARECVTSLYNVEFVCLRRISDARNIEEHPGLNDIGVIANLVL